MKNTAQTEPFLVIGNWKMNGTRELLHKFACDLETTAPAGCTQVLCLPSVIIPNAVDALADHNIEIGGQNCSSHPSGAFTGEVSSTMLVEAGAKWVIVGHSERRTGFSETDEEVNSKADAAITGGLVPIICVGECSADREDGRHLDVILDQLAASTPSNLQLGEAVIAYEPVWAIGSGKSASEDQVREAHDAIAAWLKENLVPLPVLYGGSVKPDSAADLAAIRNVDGFLVGGASLDPASFKGIGTVSSETLSKAQR
ncbi:triose-phosphate isomerase [Ruegeria sp. MALMAid1280]|uniref:triose-phosphate isomerase n=1 Tax=Ruegeria sp. MALMAid1280 TaxID=3411634 RepID=UPI003BA0361A